LGNAGKADDYLLGLYQAHGAIATVERNSCPVSRRSVTVGDFYSDWRHAVLLEDFDVAFRIARRSPQH
jgi:hypothetical protein